MCGPPLTSSGSVTVMMLYSHVSRVRHGVTTVVTRTVTGDKMTVAMECRGVAATAIFRRKQL